MASNCTRCLRCGFLGRCGFCLSKPMITGFALALLSVALLTLPVANAQALTWTTVTSPTSNALNSVYCVSASACWAVGASRTIIQWTGSSWATVTSPTSDYLLSVFVDSGWAVGVSGTIIRGDPVSATTTTTTATTVIPEYLLLGLPVLAIFMLIAYGLVKRRTRNPKNI